jgi:hypothetical protein
MPKMPQEFLDLLELIETEGVVTPAFQRTIRDAFQTVTSASSRATPEMKDAILQLTMAMYAEIKFRRSPAYQPPVHHKLNS